MTFTTDAGGPIILHSHINVDVFEDMVKLIENSSWHCRGFQTKTSILSYSAEVSGVCTISREQEHTPWLSYMRHKAEKQFREMTEKCSGAKKASCVWTVLTLFANVAVATTTITCLQITSVARRLFITVHRQFGHSWWRGYWIIIYIDARSSTYLNTFGGACTPVRPLRPSTAWSKPKWRCKKRKKIKWNSKLYECCCDVRSNSVSFQ